MKHSIKVKIISGAICTYDTEYYLVCSAHAKRLFPCIQKYNRMTLQYSLRKFNGAIRLQFKRLDIGWAYRGYKKYFATFCKVDDIFDMNFRGRQKLTLYCKMVDPYNV